MALDPALLAQLLGQHPARRMPFDELRAGLLRNVERKFVNISRDGDVELYGYSTQCQFEQRWDLFSLIARGLILDAAQCRVVATPFPKFFNYGTVKEASRCLMSLSKSARRSMDLWALFSITMDPGAYRPAGSWPARREPGRRNICSPI
jgi:hypothetical protein